MAEVERCIHDMLPGTCADCMGMSLEDEPGTLHTGAKVKNSWGDTGTILFVSKNWVHVDDDKSGPRWVHLDLFESGEWKTV